MKRLILVVIILFMVSNVYGFLSYNRSGCSFPNQCCDNCRKAGPSLSKIIVDAAGHFLLSNSEYQKLQNRIELSSMYPVDLEELKGIIDAAISSMMSANAEALNLWETSKEMSYDQAVQEKLIGFDYAAFLEEHGLNSSIFNKVSQLLKAGDVKGCYETFFTNTSDILDKLQDLKTTIDSNQIPALADCWRVNQMFFESQLHGQYVSEVFYALD